MTPKEKAKELIDKFINATDYNGYGTECALIAVDEILEAGKDVDEFADAYWQEVKQEVNQL